MKVSVPITVSIDWSEELVDNDRSNFYIRLMPRVAIKKVGAKDNDAKRIGKQVLEAAAAGHKNIKVKR